MGAIFAFRCRSCDEVHEGAPSFSFECPAGYDAAVADDHAGHLGTDLCQVGDDRFVRVCLEIPIIGTEQVFMWGVWVSLGEESFQRYVDTWDDPDERDEYFGWFCNRLPYYPDTLLLKTLVHPRKGGMRPWLELEPTDHPLSVDAREGISVQRAQEIAEVAMHSE